MSDKEQAGNSATTGRVSVDYAPIPGGKSMLTGISGNCFGDYQNPLIPAIRSATMDWLATCLAVASDAPFSVARDALAIAIPGNMRGVLDGGEAFIVAVDQAAIMLGCEPRSVALRRMGMHS